MSAWLVTNGHIDVLVNALGQYGLLDGRDPKVLGQILWTENNRSVNYRYSERSRHPRYVLRTSEAPLHPVAVLKAIHCFKYQSCERPDWNSSTACKLVHHLEVVILEERPELAERVPSSCNASRTEPAYHQHKVYGIAPWGFDSLAQAFAINY